MRRTLALLLVLLVHTMPAAADRPDGERARTVDLGAIELSDSEVSGRRLSAVLADGPAIVHLWATWCAPCREELPALADFADRLRREGLSHRLVLISIDSGGYGRIRRFLEDDLGLPDLHSWQADGRTVGAVFNVRGYPTTVMLDADHDLVVRHAGVLAWADKQAQDELVRYLRDRGDGGGEGHDKDVPPPTKL